MTRGRFISAGIEQAVSYVELRAPDKPPRRTAVLDFFALAPRFWSSTTQQVAQILYHNIRRLQIFFPRVLIGQEGTVKPGKESRRGRVEKQQALDGKFSLKIDSPRYIGARIAAFNLIAEQRELPNSGGLADVEIVNGNGEGEVGFFMAFEAELARDDPIALPVPEIDRTETSLSEDDARKLVAALENDLSIPGAAYDTPVAQPNEDPAEPWSAHAFVLDGDFVIGAADKVYQRWWFVEDRLRLEIVDVHQAISAAGEAVYDSFFRTYAADAEGARGRRASAQPSDHPLYDNIIADFDAAKVTYEQCSVVAFGVEALVGDFGCKEPDGVGEVTLARLGVLANGDWHLWQELVHERSSWAMRVPFHRSILRHFLHPGASPSSQILAEDVDARGNSLLPYMIWISPRRHAHENLRASFTALHLPYADQIKLDTPNDPQTQAYLWRILTEEIGVIPPEGWVVSGDPLAFPAAAPVSAAGTGEPGTSRSFPILGSNLTEEHLELLSLPSDVREQYGVLGDVHVTGNAGATSGDWREAARVAAEADELAAEVEAEWALSAAADEDERRYYVVPDGVIDDMRAKRRAYAEEQLAARNERFGEFLETFLGLASKYGVKIPPQVSLKFRPVSYNTDELIDQDGNVIATVASNADCDYMTQRLRQLTPTQARQVFPNGSFSISALKVLESPGQVAKTERTLVDLRKICTGVTKALSIPLLSERAERLERILKSGFLILLKPTVLRRIMEMPQFRICEQREGLARVFAVGTWYGLRKFLDFAEKAQADSSFDLDKDSLEDLAQPLQIWLSPRHRQKQKAHIFAALQALGFASVDTLIAALVPTRDFAARSLALVKTFEDRQWLAYREICNAVTWGRRASLQDVTLWVLEMALHAAVPESTVVDELCEEERIKLLGGVPVFVIDPRPKYRLSSSRAWWRASDGPPGDLLQEEIQAERDTAAEERANLVNEILETFRTKPHRTFIGTDELDDWATRLNYHAVRELRASGNRNAQHLFKLIVEELLEGTVIDSEDVNEITGFLGGWYNMEPGVRGATGLRWYSSSPELYPEPQDYTPVRKRKAAPEPYAPGTRKSSRRK
ncbi:hypothetical protein JCM10449v2_007144 [Rhodotorula kratochvilovae]